MKQVISSTNTNANQNVVVGSSNSIWLSSGNLSKLATRLIEENGFTPDQLDLKDDTSPSNLRFMLASKVIARKGYHEAEARVLFNGKQVEESLLSNQYDLVMRKLRSGMRIIPAELLSGWDSKLVKVVGKPNTFLRLAFPGIVECKPEEAAVFALSGGALVASDYYSVNRFIAKLNDEAVEVVQKILWMVEDILVESVKQSHLDVQVLAHLLRSGKVVDNKAVGKYTYGEVEMDPTERTLNGKKILRRIWCRKSELTSIQAMALFAMSLIGVTQGSTARAKLSVASSIFEEVSTGYMFTAENCRNYIKNLHKVGFMALDARKCRGGSPKLVISDNRTPEEVTACGDYFISQGMPVAYESQMKWVTVGVGAEVMLVALDPSGKYIDMSTDASKETKYFNRQKLGCSYTMNVVDSHGNSCIVASGLRIRLSDGSYAVGYGVAVKTGVSNCVLTPGSGVGLVAPGVEWIVSMDKTVRIQFNAVYLKQDMLEDADDKRDKDQRLIDVVKSNIEIEYGKLEYGTPIVKFKGHPYKQFDGKGMTALVVGEPIYAVASKSDSVTVTLKVRCMYTCSAHKFKSDGVKATGYETEYTITDVFGNSVELPELLLTGEEIKGMGLALVRAWADTIPGGVDYDPKVGLTPDQEAAFEAWRERNCREVEISVRVNKRHFKLLSDMVERARVDENYRKKMKLDPDAFTFGDDGCTVTQRCWLLVATMVLAIEGSTVRENMTQQPMIGEQLMIAKTFMPEVVDHYWEESRSQRDAVQTMLDQALQTETDDVFEVAAVFRHDQKLKGRKLLKHYLRKFPNGITFVVEGASCVVHFDALLALGAISASGSATGVALSVIELLDWMHESKSGHSGWDAMAKRRIAKVAEASTKWADANGVLARVAKTKNIMDGRKVKLTIGPELEDGYIGFNEEDPIVLNGTVHDEDGATLYRTPMTSAIGVRVRITKFAPIGTVLVDAMIWAMGNEGDGDGDPASEFFIMFDGMFKDILDRILKDLQTSPFGIKGYEIAHCKGNGKAFDILESPYADFYGGNANADKSPKTAKFQITKVAVVDYQRAARDAGRHYSRFVGKTFGMTSYLTYLAGKKLETTGVIDDGLIEAVVISWRRIYEGLALGGCSSEAVLFARRLTKLARKDKLAIGALEATEAENNGYDVQKFETKDGRTIYLIKGDEAMQWTLEKALNRSIDFTVAKYMRVANFVTYLYNVLEEQLGPDGNLDEALRGMEHLYDYVKIALIYGTIRRGSKGLAVGLSYEKETDNGMFRQITQEMLDSVGNGIVRDILEGIVNAQYGICDLRAQQAEADSDEVVAPV